MWTPPEGLSGQRLGAIAFVLNIPLQPTLQSIFLRHNAEALTATIVIGSWSPVSNVAAASGAEEWNIASERVQAGEGIKCDSCHE
jgi:hypothetical protein